MSSNLFVPDLSGSSCKDVILQVLLEEWPLSPKEVFNRVKRLSKEDVSYQAVHKAIVLLEKSKVLSKVGGKYSIDVKWVENLSTFTDFLKKNLSSDKVGFNLGRKMIFSTVYEVDQFLCELGKFLAPTKTDAVALYWNHFWIPLFFDNKTYREMKDLIVSANYYAVTKASTPLDNWCASFWKGIGLKEKTGVKEAYDTDMFVCRDFIVQVFYPYEIKKEIDKVYKSVKNVSELDVNKFFRTVFEKKTRIPVLISKNEEVAAELIKQTKEMFGE
ncbi:MAG: hypothetical protein WCW13_06880 [archaeon]|jgi:hypothetical protein